MDTIFENAILENGEPPSRHSEAGMTTAEYTVGTLGACSVAAILIKLAHKSIY